MKRFKLKYSPIIWVLLAVVIVLSLCGLVWNIFSIIEYAELRPMKVVSASILAFLCLVLTLVSLSIVFYGRYVIKGDYLYSYFGIIKSGIQISSITQIIHFKKSDKLVLYFGEKNFLVAMISPSLFEELVIALREVNKGIIFDNRIEGEDTPN